jgi:putative ABC transport system ATP-binding protein
MSGPVVLCERVSRVYGIPPLVVKALDDVDLRVMRGEFVSLAGPSGSGKSTLLNLIGGLDRATAGSVIVEGVNLADLDTGALADLRRDRIGFVFQAYNLIPVLSARENVEFIMELQGIKSSERRRRALEALGSLGIAELENRRPGELSGGQQQRVAVARAIVTEPSILLADEPSANLDSESTAGLLRLLQHINREHGVTIITATHDPAVIAFAARRISMRDGRIVADERATPA